MEIATLLSILFFPLIKKKYKTQLIYKLKNILIKIKIFSSIIMFGYKNKNNNTELVCTIFSILYFILCTFLMVIIQVIIECNQYNNQNIILNDIMFKLFPVNIYKSEELIELLVNISVIYVIIRAFWEKNTKHRLFQQAFITIGTVYILRAVVLSSTQLPNPYKQCNSMINTDTPILINILSVMMKLKRTCSDVLFSGHAMTMTLLILLARDFFSDMEYLIMGVYSISTCVLIIISKFHYTVDVVIGIIITFLIYSSISMIASSEYNSLRSQWFPIKSLVKNLIPSSRFSKTSKTDYLQPFNYNAI